jgi:hypothetical protein
MQALLKPNLVWILQVFSACMILSNLELLTSRMDEVALVWSSPQGSSKIVNFEGRRRLALKHIEAFVLSVHRLDADENLHRALQ